MVETFVGYIQHGHCLNVHNIISHPHQDVELMLVMLSKRVVITLFVATKKTGILNQNSFPNLNMFVFFVPKTNQTISTGLSQHEMEY